MTPASWLLFRTRVRERWGKLLLLAVVTAVAMGFVLTAVTGARRTATAWDRFTEASAAPDMVVSIGGDEYEALLADLIANPDIESAAAVSWVPVAPAGIDPFESGSMAALGPGFGDTILRPVLSEGRFADPGEPGEVVLNPAMVEVSDLEVGDRVQLGGLGGVDESSVVVGIGITPVDVGPNAGIPGTMLTPAFAARWMPTLIEEFGDDFRPSVLLRLTPDADFDEVASWTTTAHPNAAVGPSDFFETDVVDGLRAQTTSYVVLAAGSLVASLALIALLVRQGVRSGATDLEGLAALGQTRGQRTLQLATSEGLAVLVGTMAAVPVAILASPLVLTGLAESADPAQGRWFEGRTLAVAATGVAVVLVGMILLLARLETRPRARTRRVETPRSLGGVLGLTPPLLVGGRSGVCGSTRATRRQALAAAIGLGLAGACVIAVAAWSGSAAHLLDTPRLAGWDFDADVQADPTDASALPDVSDRLSTSPDVARLARYDVATWTVGGTDVDLYAITQEKGSLHPTLRRGRAPQGPGEIALGSDLVAQLEVDIGDSFELPGPDGPVTLTVVGEALYPPNNNGWENGASVTPETMANLGALPLRSGLWVALAPGVQLADLDAGGDVLVLGPELPPAIDHLGNVGGITDVLMVFMALIAVVVIVATGWSARQRLGGTMAVLRAAGLAPRQVVSTFWWDAVLTATVGALLAVVVGLPLGRLVWSSTEQNIGVLDASVVPTAAVVGVVLGSLLVASLAALVVGWRCSRSAIAIVLRTE